jgi:hypothetical protein
MSSEQVKRAYYLSELMRKITNMTTEEFQDWLKTAPIEDLEDIKDMRISINRFTAIVDEIIYRKYGIKR